MDTTNSQMLSLNRICLAGAVVFAVAAAVMASGCSTAGGMSQAADVRVATKLDTGAPAQMIVSGPARLLHVDVHGRQALTVYTVERAADGTVSCDDPARSAVVALQQGAANELNLTVPSGQVACLSSSAADARGGHVSWHARLGADAPAESLQASNM